LKIHKQLMIITLTAMLLMASLIVIVPNELSANATQEPWLDGWQCRKSHVINASAGAGTGYVIGIKVYNGTGTDGTETINSVSFGKVYINSTTADFREVRFTDNDAVTLLPYWIESYSAGAYAVIWVKVADDLSTDPATIYVYWSNPAAFPASYGDTVFTQFDDFEDSNVWLKEGIVIPTPSTDYTYAEPSVIVEAGAQLLSVSSSTEIFKMWFRNYRESTGNVVIEYAESLDGYDWTVRSTPVLDTAEGLWCPFVMKHEGVYYMYVHGGTDHSGWNYLDRYSSSNGISWTKDKDNTLGVGASGEWDDYALGNHFVWVEGENWYMLYEATPTGGTWYIGLATSSDGMTWVKEGSNPVFGNTSISGGGPFIHKMDSTYYCWVHSANDSTALPTDEYLIRSTDLVNWELVYDDPVIPRTEEFEGVGQVEGQVGDLHIVEYKNQLYGFYEGVHTQADHRGIALIGTGLSIEQVIGSRQNQIYYPKEYWDSSLNKFTISAGTATFNSATAVWSKSNMTNGAGYGVNYAAVFKGGIAANDNLHQGIFGFQSTAVDKYVQMVKGTTEIHRAQDSAYATVTCSFDESTHVYDLRRLSTGSNVAVDGVFDDWLTTQVPTVDMTLGIQSWNCSVAMQYAFVRPCIASEPVHSTWTATEVWAPYSEGEEPPEEPGAFSFTSTPVTSAVNGTAYSYDADVNVSGAVFSLIAGPSWLSINTATGVVSGTPDAVGSATVTIRATVNGTTADQTYTLTVSEGLISPSLMNGLMEVIIAAILLMAMVSIIGMVKVKKR